MSTTPKPNILVRVAPLIFVVLWATGYIGAKYGTMDAEPFTFLAIRFSLTLAILAVLVVVFVGRKITDHRQFLHSIFTGCLLHGIYLGGIFYAIDRGMPAGISSLVVALQPFFTALIAWMILGEKLPAKRGLFFVLALAGVALVLFPNVDFTKTIRGINTETLAAAFIGTISISLGAVYQKRFVTSLNLWVSTTGQFLGAAIVVTVLAFFLETREVAWTANLVFSLAWLILVLSIGAVGLLMYLIRKGNTSSVASLFFLVPVVALFMAWVLFGETMNLIQVFASLVVVTSVAAASRVK